MISSVCVHAYVSVGLSLSQVKPDMYLAELAKIGKSQKHTLSVDVEAGKLVVMKKVKDTQEDWTNYTHDKSETGKSEMGGG